MVVSVIVGLQWGDEGKGKIVDLLAKDYDFTVRFNGGDNAGHTVIVKDKKLALHILPSGVFYPEKMKVIGNGCVVNPETILEEIENLQKAEIEPKNIFLSDRANLILPWHKVLDGIEEKSNAIGTTKKGIGPTYCDKANRKHSVRAGDILYCENLQEKLKEIADAKQKTISHFGENANFDTQDIYNKLQKVKENVQIIDTSYFLNKAIKENRNILFEGAQGTLLDVDFGTSPYITSSNTISGAVCTGAGIPPTKVKKIYGIAKAYTTRVGNGPFPTELKDALGEKLREVGKEFGATTGRPRRCGWLDLAILKYTCMINGVTDLCLTKIDVLNGLDELKVCIGYEYNGNMLEEFPSNTQILEKAKPVYKTLKGFNITKEEWETCKQNKTIPQQIQKYLALIKKETKTKISLVSYGPERDETIIL